jgi:hypothetical protein
VAQIASNANRRGHPAIGIANAFHRRAVSC